MLKTCENFLFCTRKIVADAIIIVIIPYSIIIQPSLINLLYNLKFISINYSKKDDS